jgi:hypothetical protein
LTPLRILHIAAFVTLCETFMGIDPILTSGIASFVFGSHRARMQKWWFGGGVVIHFKSQHSIDPYFNIPMPKSMNGW